MFTPHLSATAASPMLKCPDYQIRELKIPRYYFTFLPLTDVSVKSAGIPVSPAFYLFQDRE